MKGGTGSDSCCCCCCCCISPFASLPSSSPCFLIHTLALSSPSTAHGRLGLAGPLARRHPPLWGPMVAWQAAFSSDKIHLRCSVYSRTAQRTITPLTLLPSFSFLLAFSLPLVRGLCRATTFFLLFRLLARGRDAHASISIFTIQNSMYQNFPSFLLTFSSFTTFYFNVQNLI